MGAFLRFAAFALLLVAARQLIELRAFPVHEAGVVVITGASTGIGRHAALALDARGYTVFAGVRKAKDGDSLRAEASERLHPVQLDVTSAGDIEAAAEAVRGFSEQAGLPLVALINNAGLTSVGPVERQAVDDARYVMEVNYLGAVSMTAAFLPQLRASGGRVVNVGSMFGMMSGPLCSAYAASKFALEAHTDALRAEVEPLGVAVSLLQPGAIFTPTWDKISSAAPASDDDDSSDDWGVYTERVRDWHTRRKDDMLKVGCSVDHTTSAITHAVSSAYPKTRYIVGVDAWGVWFMSSVMPDRLRDLFANAL